MPVSESLLSSRCRKLPGISRVLPATMPSGTVFMIVLCPSNCSASVALQFDGQKTIMKKVPLGMVAGKTRLMPDDFLHLEENKLSETGMAYLRRLLPQKFTPAKPFVG